MSGRGTASLIFKLSGLNWKFFRFIFSLLICFQIDSEAVWRETMGTWYAAGGSGSSVPQRGNGAPDHCQGLLHEGAAEVGPLPDLGPDPDPGLGVTLDLGDTVQDAARLL